LENTNNMTINDYFNGISLLLYRSGDVWIIVHMAQNVKLLKILHKLSFRLSLVTSYTAVVGTCHKPGDHNLQDTCSQGFLVWRYFKITKPSLGHSEYQRWWIKSSFWEGWEIPDSSDYF
jgi:hypothetical protein